MPRAKPVKPATPAKRRPSPRKGMRLHKIWLPDMDSPAFIRQARRESLAIAQSERGRADQDFVDSIPNLALLPEYREPESITTMPRAKPATPAAPAKRRVSPRKGMRLHKMWLPDMDSPALIRQARRTSLAIARSPEEKELQDWVDSVSILPLLPEYCDNLQLPRLIRSSALPLSGVD